MKKLTRANYRKLLSEAAPGDKFIVSMGLEDEDIINVHRDAVVSYHEKSQYGRTVTIVPYHAVKSYYRERDIWFVAKAAVSRTRPTLRFAAAPASAEG
jgi:hypothetical protein